MSRLAKLGLLLLLCARGASAQFTIPQRGSVANTSPQPSNFVHVTGSTTGCYDFNTARTTCVAADHVTPSAGDLRLISVSWSDISPNNTRTATVTSSNGDTWTSITPGKIFGSGCTCSQQNFRVFSSAGGADTITVTISASTTFIAWLKDSYTYTGTISGFDGTPVLTGVTSVASVATTSSVTTTNTSDLLWATCSFTPGTCTAGSGWTSRNDTNACKFDTGTCSNGHDYNGVIGLLNEDKVGVGPGTNTATFGTTGATDANIMGLAAL